MILPPAIAAQGDGEGPGGEASPGPSGHGDNTGGAAISQEGEIRSAGEAGEHGLGMDVRGERGCEVRGGVAIRGASRGGRGGPTSCRILLSVSRGQSVGVDVSAFARTGCV